MQDLKAEASFFDATAAEVAEGLVEITEEYIEETSAEKVSKAGPAKPDPSKSVAEDEEYANFMSRIDELEKEELAEENAEDEDYAHMISRPDELEKKELSAESVRECDEDEDYARMMSRLDELEKKELAAGSIRECDEDERVGADLGQYSNEDSFDFNHRSSEGHQLTRPPKQLKDECISSKELPSKHTFQQDLCKQFEGPKLQSVSEGKSPSDRSSALTQSSSAEKPLVLPKVEENIQAEPQSTNKAFTGSIVEHAFNIEVNPREQTTASSKSIATQTAKPVSRFKMQRR